MKKIAAMCLGLSLIVGSTCLFAGDTTTQTTKKKKKRKKESSSTEKKKS